MSMLSGLRSRWGIITKTANDPSMLKKKEVSHDASSPEEKTQEKKAAAKKDPPERKKPDSSSKALNLEKYARNLVSEAAAKKLEPLIGREEELDSMICILCKKTKNNPLLIGEPGVSKSSLAEGLAQRIAEGKVPSMMSGMQIYALDMTHLVAGTRYRGDFEERSYHCAR